MYLIHSIQCRSFIGGLITDLTHYHCNSVYVPWVSRGQRRSKTNWESARRNNAISYAARAESLTYRLSGSSTRIGVRFLSQEHQHELSVLRPPVRKLTLPTENICHLRGRNEKLEWFMPASAVMRSMSPDPLPAHGCSGWCEPALSLTKAHVICLSACADPERAWEAGPITMTSVRVPLCPISEYDQLT